MDEDAPAEGAPRVAELATLEGDWGVTPAWEWAVSCIRGAFPNEYAGFCNGLPVLRSNRV